MGSSCSLRLGSTFRGDPSQLHRVGSTEYHTPLLGKAERVPASHGWRPGPGVQPEPERQATPDQPLAGLSREPLVHLLQKNQHPGKRSETEEPFQGQRLMWRTPDGSEPPSRVVCCGETPETARHREMAEWERSVDAMKVSHPH